MFDNKKAHVKKTYLDLEYFFVSKCLYAYRPTWEDLWWLILKLQGLKEKIAKGWTPTLYTYILFLSQITSLFYGLTRFLSNSRMNNVCIHYVFNK